MYPPNAVTALASQHACKRHPRRRRDRGRPRPRGARSLGEVGQIEEGEALVRLEWAESLAAAGRTDEARGALGRWPRRLLAKAERVADRACVRRSCPRSREHDRMLRLRRASGEWSQPLRERRNLAHHAAPECSGMWHWTTSTVAGLVEVAPHDGRAVTRTNAHGVLLRLRQPLGRIATRIDSSDRRLVGVDDLEEETVQVERWAWWLGSAR